jgi:cobalt-precorrin-5B (C1)-methyltransferase
MTEHILKEKGLQETSQKILNKDEKILRSDSLEKVWQEGRYWRRGITTGTCATAGAKAATQLLLTNQAVSEVVVDLPSGQKIRVPVKDLAKEGDIAYCTVIKDGGDDPDITHGLPIVAQVQLTTDNEIVIQGGPGVGQVTKPGLQIPPNQAAINPVPRRMIKDNVGQLLNPGQGALITISVPGGEEKALHTMNPQLGILGGISILGTTGIVEPMSEEAFKNSLVVRVRQVKALGYDTLILVPGRIGEKAAQEKYNLPEELMAQMSNFVGFMLEKGAQEGFKKILIIGHLGKTVKLASGIFHTHSRIADGRLETIAAWLGTLGAKPNFLKEILTQVTTEGAVNLIRKQGYEEVFEILARKGEERCKSYLRGQVEEVGIVITDIEGNPLGLGPVARKIGGELDWAIK